MTPPPATLALDAHAALGRALDALGLVAVVRGRARYPVTAAETAIVAAIRERKAPGWAVANDAWTVACAGWWALADTALPVARAEARRRAARLPVEDLVQEGRVGLYRAAQRWAPGPVRFDWFAGPYVRRAQERAIARSQTVCVSTWTAAQEARDRRLAAYEGRASAAPRVSVSLDALGDVAVEGEQEPAAIVGQLRAGIGLVEDPRLRGLLEALLAGDTPAEIGARLGVSRTRFFQLQTRAVGRLRALLEAP